MKFRSTRRWPRLCLRLSPAFLLGCTAAFGCAGELAISYLFSTEAELLAAPPGAFVEELARLTLVREVAHRAVPAAPEDSPPRRETNPRPATAAQDTADLRRALEQRGDTTRSITAIVDGYAAARGQLETWIQARARRLAVADGDGRRREPDEPLPALELPAGVPAEFARYFAGAAAWHQGRWDEARSAWREVLALPERERPYRSTWAAFMLGRLAAEESANRGWREQQAKVAEARAWSRRTRELAAEGFADPLGLAAASYGWEARALFDAEDYLGAIDLYLLQQATGDTTALESLRRVAARAINAPPDQLRSLARDRNSRGVLTAYLLSRGRSLFSDQVHDSGAASEAATRWAAALARAEVKEDPHADRLAWLAYEGGLFALARDWVVLAPASSAMAEWIRAQLALRAGHLAEGEARLRGALAGEGLNEEQRRRALGELARTCLALDRPADALTAWLEGNHWEDADYLARRGLTLEELRAYVDARPMSPVRPVLALRLARNHQVDLAVNYYADELQPIFRAYIADVRTGFTTTVPAEERARAFWRAARAAHERGDELLGREVRAEYYPTLVEKRADARAVEGRQDARLGGGVFATTPAELARLESLSTAEKNFRHFRYRAAELAWWAASLLPNDSDETAEILATAGGWLKARDPEAAQPFYQALVIRCGNTALGRAAAERRWLPAASGSR